MIPGSTAHEAELDTDITRREEWMCAQALTIEEIDISAPGSENCSVRWMLGQERCVRSMAAVCREVIVVDSGSTDDTVALAAAAGARVVHQAWLGFAAQKNLAISLAAQPWVLLLDADGEPAEVYAPGEIVIRGPHALPVQHDRAFALDDEFQFRLLGATRPMGMKGRSQVVEEEGDAMRLVRHRRRFNLPRPLRDQPDQGEFARVGQPVEHGARQGFLGFNALCRGVEDDLGALGEVAVPPGLGEGRCVGLFTC